MIKIAIIGIHVCFITVALTAGLLLVSAVLLVLSGLTGSTGSIGSSILVVPSRFWI